MEKGAERVDSDHRMVVAMLERKEERVKAVLSSEKGSNVRVWRTRDRGDLSYWDQLRPQSVTRRWDSGVTTQSSRSSK